MSERVARSRELVARGFAVAAVARVMQISRQAVSRVPRPRSAPQPRPPADPVERAIVEEARANQTDGYRMVTAFVRRRLGVAVNRKRVLRVLRERKLIQRRRPLKRRKRPGFLPSRAAQAALAARPDERLGRRARLDVPDGDHRLLHPRDRRLAPRAAVPRQRGDRARRACCRRARHPARQADAGHRQRLGVHRARVQARPQRLGRGPSPRRLPRPKARRSSSHGLPSSRNAASSCTSSRPSTRPGR